jgi:hypothetical protein
LDECVCACVRVCKRACGEERVSGQSLVKSRVHRRRRRRDDFSFLGVSFGSLHRVSCSHHRRRHKLISVHLYKLHQLHIRRPILFIYSVYTLTHIYICQNSISPRGIGRNRMSIYRRWFEHNCFALPQRTSKRLVRVVRFL